MLELPEVMVISRQLNSTVSGKKILNVTAAGTPHKFAWFYGDPQNYHQLLSGKTVVKAEGHGGMVEIKVEDAVMLFGDGVSLKYHDHNEQRPQKHQLLVEFDDYSAISASIKMYGGMWAFKDGEFDYIYYNQAKEKTPPLSDKFNTTYFYGLIGSPEVQKLSAKAFLATEQRIPGLGNGVLQDILYNAGIHPKKKVNSFTGQEKDTLFDSIKSTLAEMTFKGGRDTERDLFGCSGGYITKLSKNTVDKPCPVCGTVIKKESYMGGSIYYCSGCQKL